MRRDEKLLIFDGAMGTYYMGQSNKPAEKCELANIYDKETVLNIHKAYIGAGCNAIKTNTFGANKFNLGCDDKLLKQIIEAGYHLANEAAQLTGAKVFADIGPIAGDDEEVNFKHYKEIADLFLNMGAAYFIFETFSHKGCLAELAKYIKSQQPEAYILVSFAVSPEGYTRLGVSGKKLMKEMLGVEAIDSVGFNCFSGPKHLLTLLKEVLKELRPAHKPIAIMPNSGYPTIINNRTFFNNSPVYFAKEMGEIVKTGAEIIGGCCGTTPEMLSETVKAVNQLEYIQHAEKVAHADNMTYINEAVHADTLTQADKVINRSESLDISSKRKKEQTINLMDKVRSGKKIIAVELDPPVDTEISFFMESAAKLQAIGADAITIADCPIARARVDSSLLACKLKRDLNMTAIPHMTCRDRNINATKALLLGLNIEGVRDVLVVTGDPIPTAQRDEIKAIFSFNSKILASYIRELNETSFAAPFNIYGALNINAVNFESELRKAKQKVASGVTMFLTQPVLTKKAVENLKQAHEVLEAKILGGIIPVVSYRNACFMNNEISGITVAEEIIRLYEDADKEKASNMAVAISAQIAKEIADYVDGYYLITPFKRIDLITQIIEHIQGNTLIE